MKNITNDLSAEHQNILKVIDLVFIECNKLESGSELDKSFFEKAIDFIKNYADRYHHAKEEDILFKVMVDNAELMHCNPIPVMLHEHDSGRDFVRAIEEGLEENDKEKVIENAKGYGYLLQEHIHKEDMVLYPMAEETIDDFQKEEVLKKYQEVETYKFSKEEIQKYLSILDQ